MLEAADAVRRAARKAGFGDREVFSAERGFDWAAFEDGMSSMSLFAERRLVELRLPTPKAANPGSDVLVRVLKSPPDDVLLLATAPRLEKASRNAAWFKAFASAGEVVEGRRVLPRDLPGWISGRMRRAGLVPDVGAVRLLAERCEGNLLAAHQEIEKLRLLLGEGEVDEAGVRDAVSDSARYDVFRLADAAAAGDRVRALKVLAGLRSEGTEPVLVLWALGREVRDAAKVRWLTEHGMTSSAALSKAGVWRSRAGNVSRAAGRHDAAGLRRLLRLAARADRAIKGSEREDPWQVLTTLVTGFAGAGMRKAA